MAGLELLLRYWRAQDELFERVDATPWGAVVSDARYPLIQEANYARVEAREDVPLAHVESRLLPAMARSGTRRAHVVVFHPEACARILAEASTRGERLTWDLVMEFRGRARAAGPAEEIRGFDGGFWRDYEASARLFDIEDDSTLGEMAAIERELMIPAGRRWFAARDESGGTIALASLLVLDGAGYLDHVATFPGARRRGHATALTRRALAEAHDAGAERVYLLAEPDGPAAALYARVGFRPVTHIASWISPIRAG